MHNPTDPTETLGRYDFAALLYLHCGFYMGLHTVGGKVEGKRERERGASLEYLQQWVEEVLTC